MFKNLPYKKKLKILGIVFILVMFICYKLAFSKTIEQYSSFKTQYKLNASLNNQGSSFQTLKMKERKINEFFNQFVLDTIQNEKNFLFVCGEFCKTNNIKIKEYTPYNISTGSNLKTVTKSVTVEGDFRSILNLIYYLETQKKIGHLISANFKSNEDPRDKSTKLNSTIYIQNLLFKNHEN
jgi:hypothetical protein